MGTLLNGRFASLLALGALGFGVAGCSTKDANGTKGGGDPPAGGVTSFCQLPVPCQKISQACMPKDDGLPGPIHDCHMTGMQYGIEADCERDLEGCISMCNAAPGFGGPPLDLYAECRDGGTVLDADTSARGESGAGANAEGGIVAATDAGPLSFPTAPLSTFTSSEKDLHIELRTAPEQPIHVGPGSEGELRVSDISTGAAVDGLEIAVTTWMPIMGHKCSPVPVNVEPLGQGVYWLTPLLASMKGACELKLTFSGAKSEHAVSPTFDIAE